MYLDNILIKKNYEDGTDNKGKRLGRREEKLL